MPIDQITVKVNIEGLEKIGEFLDEYGDKLSLVGALNLKPDSVLVFKSPGMLSQESIKRVRDQIKKVFPKHEVIILEDNMSLEVVLDPSDKASDQGGGGDGR